MPQRGPAKKRDAVAKTIKRLDTTAKTSQKAAHRSKDPPKGCMHTAAKKKQQVLETATKPSQQAGQRSEDQPKDATPQKPKGGTPQQRPATRLYTAS
jgi:hypothetical protein